MSLLDIFKIFKKKNAKKEDLTVVGDVKTIEELRPSKPSKTPEQTEEERKQKTENQLDFAKTTLGSLLRPYKLSNMTDEFFSDIKKSYDICKENNYSAYIHYHSNRSTPPGYGPGDPTAYINSLLTVHSEYFELKGNVISIYTHSSSEITAEYTRDESFNQSNTTCVCQITKQNNKLFIMNDYLFPSTILIEGKIYNIYLKNENDQLTFTSNYPNSDELQAALQDFFPDKKVIKKNISSAGVR